MANYGIRIDLLKLQGAFVRDLTGATATKKCIIIPVDECDSIYLGAKGCYLNMTAIEMQNPQYGDTHCIKGELPREKREAMTDEQRRAIPILGGLRPFQPKQQTQQAGETAQAPAASEDDMPF